MRGVVVRRLRRFHRFLVTQHQRDPRRVGRVSFRAVKRAYRDGNLVVRGAVGHGRRGGDRNL